VGKQTLMAMAGRAKVGSDPVVLKRLAEYRHVGPCVGVRPHRVSAGRVVNADPRPEAVSRVALVGKQTLMAMAGTAKVGSDPVVL
jgi:hypothetical protein